MDERGSLTEIIRKDWPEFRGFAQATVTVNLPGVIRAWHWHDRQTAFVVVRGTAKIVLFDARAGAETRGDVNELVLGEEDLALLVVPPGVYHGYMTVSGEPAHHGFPRPALRSSCAGRAADRLRLAGRPVPLARLGRPLLWSCCFRST